MLTSSDALAHPGSKPVQCWLLRPNTRTHTFFHTYLVRSLYRISRYVCACSCPCACESCAKHLHARVHYISRIWVHMHMHACVHCSTCASGARAAPCTGASNALRSKPSLKPRFALPAAGPCRLLEELTGVSPKLGARKGVCRPLAAGAGCAHKSSDSGAELARIASGQPCCG